MAGGYIGIEAIVYAALPHWKWKSADLLIGMFVLTFGLAMVREKTVYLRRVLIMSLLLMTPVFIGMVSHQPLSMAMQYRTIGFSLACASGFFALQAFLPVGSIRKILSRLFYGSIFLLCLIFWGYYFSAGSLLNASAIMAVFQTNPAEARSYLMDFMPWQGLLILLLLLVVYVACLRKWTRSLTVYWGGTTVLENAS